MSDKRVQDVSSDYDDGHGPAGDAKITRIRREAKPLFTGKLEKNVDAILRSKGVTLDEPLPAKALRSVPLKRGRRLRAKKA